MGKKREDYPGMYPLRHCHDCGQPTRDYRCAKCRRKFARRYMVDRDCLDTEEYTLPCMG